jgi:uncharacterized membrane protein YidH (DUF202 family)
LWAIEKMPAALIIAFGIALSLAAVFHVYSIETTSRRDMPPKKRRFSAFVYSLLAILIFVISFYVAGSLINFSWW